MSAYDSPTEDDFELRRQRGMAAEQTGRITPARVQAAFANIAPAGVGTPPITSTPRSAPLDLSVVGDPPLNVTEEEVVDNLADTFNQPQDVIQEAMNQSGVTADDVLDLWQSDELTPLSPIREPVTTAPTRTRIPTLIPAGVGRGNARRPPPTTTSTVTRPVTATTTRPTATTRRSIAEKRPRSRAITASGPTSATATGAATTTATAGDRVGATRMNQEELQRQLELLLNDQRQTSRGRRIAGITTTNTITTTYKDSGRPTVRRTSTRVSNP